VPSVNCSSCSCQRLFCLISTFSCCICGLFIFIVNLFKLLFSACFFFFATGYAFWCNKDFHYGHCCRMRSGNRSICSRRHVTLCVRACVQGCDVTDDVSPNHAAANSATARKSPSALDFKVDISVSKATSGSAADR